MCNQFPRGRGASRSTDQAVAAASAGLIVGLVIIGGSTGLDAALIGRHGSPPASTNSQGGEERASKQGQLLVEPR